VRIFVNNIAILERAGLGFVRVANEIDRPFLVGLDEAPLNAAGKTGAAAAAQAGSLHLIHDFRARHFHGSLQLLITAVPQVAIDVGCPIRAPDVFENEAMLEGVGGSLRFEV
jgi:hypothetical protein